MAEKHKEGEELVESYNKAEQFFNENKNIITGIGIGVLVLVLGFAYLNMKYLPEQEAEAQSEIYAAQFNFEKDSFNLALYGNIEDAGFVDIMKKYKWTKAANLSKYYAGVCELKLGNYDQAIKYLKGFNSKGDEMLESVSLGSIGDANAEKGNMDAAIKWYKKAAASSDNELTTPIMLKKAGMALEFQGKQKDALKMYQKIKKEYPRSQEGREIDKYIARAGGDY